MRYGDQSEVVEFLGRPADGTAGDDDTRIIETHISIVVLRGDRAWKLKRALRLPYADFSTPALRAAACDEEVRLNRRTAASLYLGARRITREADGRLALDGDGELVDAAVEMRRFDEDTLFSRLAPTGGLDRTKLTALARTIVAFHAQAPAEAGHEGARRIASVLSLNEQCEDMGPVLGDEAVARLRTALRTGLEQHRERLDTRAAAGKVRHCHGDLHLRNLCLVDDQPTLFDCIEFSAELATIDVLYDLAFLLMDLWQAGLTAEANWVMNRYIDESDDVEDLPLLPFFMALRASIRAQVLATQLRVPEAPQKQDTLQRARDYLSLSMRLLEPAAPSLLAIGGYSGSGKSTVAAAIAHRIGVAPGARVLATDRIRKRLAGVPAETALPPWTYTRESSERVYATLEEQAARTLADGYSVIADAVFSQPGERERIRQCAARRGVAFHGVWLTADREALIGRVEARRGDPSDATPEVVITQLGRDPGPMDWTVLATGGPAESIAEDVMAAMADGASSAPPWSEAPDGWDWLAQDEDGRWFWYAVQPQLGVGGGVWRAPRRAQRLAARGTPNTLWYESCRQRPQR